jgi:hypothetical protein
MMDSELGPACVVSIVIEPFEGKLVVVVHRLIDGL